MEDKGLGKNMQRIVASAGKELLDAAGEKALDVTTAMYGAVLEEVHGRQMLAAEPQPDPATRTVNEAELISILEGIQQAKDALDEVEEAAASYRALHEEVVAFVRKVMVQDVTKQEFQNIVNLCEQIDPTCFEGVNF